MKKNLSIMALVCFASATSAQFKRGNLQVIGSVSASSATIHGGNATTAENIQNSGASFTIRAGTFISDGSVVGLVAGYSSSLYDYNTKTSGNNYDSFQQRQNQYTVGLYYTWYKPLGNRIFFSLTAMPVYGFGSSVNRDENGSNSYYYKSNFHQFLVGLSPGITYSINNHWALTGSLGILSYSNSASKPVETQATSSSTLNTYTTHNNGVNLDLRLSSLSIGAIYFITRSN